MTETTQRTSASAIVLRYVVPLVITCGLCWLLFRDFDFAQMWQVIRTECRFGWIVAMLCISVLSHIFRALRWQIQLQALRIKAPLWTVVLSIFGMYGVNLVLPRLGEIWRTTYVARREDAPFATVFGSMVADRMADMLTVLALIVLTAFAATDTITDYLSQGGDLGARIASIVRSGWLWAAAACGIVSLWWLMCGKITNRTLLKIREFIKDLWKGFAVIVRMPRKWVWLIYTVGIWGCYFVQMYVAFFAFGFTEEVVASHGIVAVLVTFVLSSISMSVPSNGGIGPWQWAVIFGLGIYGLDGVRAATFANLVMGANTLLVISLGLFTFTCIALTKNKTQKHNKKCQK